MSELERLRERCAAMSEGLRAMTNLPPSVAAWIIARTSDHGPDFVIGGLERPYILRWYVTPQSDQGNTYLHNIQRDDDDRALHDHPWDNTSIVLCGKLREVVPSGARILRAGDVVHRLAEDQHRLEVVELPIWTLFLTGPKRRDWGFWCPQGFVPWQKFVDPTDSGRVGPGCGS